MDYLMRTTIVPIDYTAMKVNKEGKEVRLKLTTKIISFDI